MPPDEIGRWVSCRLLMPWQQLDSRTSTAGMWRHRIPLELLLGNILQRGCNIIWLSRIAKQFGQLHRICWYIDSWTLWNNRGVERKKRLAVDNRLCHNSTLVFSMGSLRSAHAKLGHVGRSERSASGQSAD